MLCCIDSLSLEHQLLLLLIGVAAFGLESLWRSFFTPKSPSEQLRELARSDEPRDHQVLLEILDEDPTAWNAAPAEPWDIAADLRALARPFRNQAALPGRFMLALARALPLRNRPAKPASQPVKA